MRRGLTTATAVLTLLMTGPPASGASLWDTVARGLPSPGIDAPGVNRPCRPTPAHPHPVVLLHGWTGDRTVTWNPLGPALVRAGYCVFAVDYGHRGTEPMEDSAPTIARFVDHVLAATGARTVALVGYSEGGLIARYYLRFLGGAAKVDELVGIAPPNHGTTHPVFPLLATTTGCTVCREAAPDSAFLQRLNAGAETSAGVDVTTIATARDDLVVPYASAFLAGPPGRVTNVTLQDTCPLDPADHFLIVGDPVVQRWVLRALGRPGPASLAPAMSCTPWG